MSKSRNLKILEVSELTTNTFTGAYMGGLSNLVVNGFRNKPPSVYSGVLLGSTLFFGATRIEQNINKEISKTVDERWHLLYPHNMG